MGVANKLRTEYRKIQPHSLALDRPMPGACLSHAGCIDGFSPAGFQSSVLLPVVIFVRFSLIPAALQQQQQQHFRSLLKLAMPGSGASVLLTTKLCLTVFPLALCPAQQGRAAFISCHSANL